MLEEEIKRKEAEMWNQKGLGMISEEEETSDQNSSADDVMLASPILPPPPLSLTTTTALHNSAYLPLIGHREDDAQKIREGAGIKLVKRQSGRSAQRSRKIQFKKGKLLGKFIIFKIPHKLEFEAAMCRGEYGRRVFCVRWHGSGLWRHPCCLRVVLPAHKEDGWQENKAGMYAPGEVSWKLFWVC